MKKSMYLLLSVLFAQALLAQTPAPPSPPPPPPVSEDEMLRFTFEQPSFPGCENFSEKSEKSKCATEKIDEFINANLRYPEQAKTSSIQGNVYVKFDIEKDGTITNAKVIKDIGGGCGEEALRIVNLMPKWNPGMQRGRPIRVQFNLPVKFCLN